ncbi:MAG: glycosyl hydrolase 53 family protein [Lachnospiraceae bacterium]|nr:glycosyl hydrolase 53 family protein [Lachnospiraceae bacterium]
MKFRKAALLCLLAGITVLGAGCGNKIKVEHVEPLDRPAEIFVEKVDGLTEDFMLGVDVSTALVQEKSGVVYYNEDGVEQDIMKTLAENGVNTIRLRVWNDPYDAAGNGYGGGNNDLETAIELGKRATQYGLGVIIDFHYSDFWADPAKQMVPKAWEGMDLAAKAEALYTYTKESMDKLLDAGVNVVMVQVGNETTTGMAGEKNWSAIGVLMNRGSQAVREMAEKYEKEILVGVHFTNPEKSDQYTKYADYLVKFKVDYDVFITSYYPYWHGTLENLTTVLGNIATNYGKKVMVGEISWAYTMEDGDFNGNSISADSAVTLPYSVTVQGQADCIRETTAALTSLGDSAIGICYWEPAWIPVPGNSWEECSALWEKYGSGWASSFAKDYDPNDAGKYYGGSAWDNQAMFDYEGKPLASLSVFRHLADGATTDLKLDYIGTTVVTVRLKDPVTLPETVLAKFNDGSEKEVPVTWDTSSINLETVSFNGVNSYIINGTAAEGSSTMPAVCVLDIVEKNYVENPGFESEDMSMWTITDSSANAMSELYVIDKVTDASSGTKSLHFYSTNNMEFSAEQTVTGLKAGTYNFSVTLHGGDANTQEIIVYAIADGQTYETTASITAWREFTTPKIEGITTTDGNITVGIRLNLSGGAWGNIDDFLLAPVEE